MTHRRLGLISVALFAVILFVWIPLDVETGIIEKVRRQKELGDAFAPFVAALLIGLGGLLLAVEKKPDASNQSSSGAQLSSGSDHSNGKADLTHAAVLIILLSIALLLMRYVGPLAVALFDDSNTEYRLLRDTAPWKYLGFIAGGMWLIVSFIVFIERRLRVKHILIALIVVCVLIALYDLPFDTLLLPPNGDV